MDEQGIYCPQCRAYVHFWSISRGGHPPRGVDAKKPVPGTQIEMPQACQQCGYKSTYKTSDLRTRRVPTEPVRDATLGPVGRHASTIDVHTPPGNGKVSGPR
jgi:DNA-directed RNA polymerase subunit RPC12/RpoP